ncbi:hypothetical protein JVT61DRAFT_2883 [Boletus reticuloceps]|uniref:Uncharacterized protein n=1 Tax=Boletus reticuloceps TaxID=495285 RepID=A0A8I2YN81_9AGAM|nr:hypothetical protein JVT61DRAFT_2883 [Boletus reticuloceps]
MSNRAGFMLLETSSAGAVHEHFTFKLKVWIKINQQELCWTWPDSIAEQPQPAVDEQPAMDNLENPLAINIQESLGNQNAQLQSYLKLHDDHHKKMQQIVKLTLSPELSAGFSGHAVPEVLKHLEDLLLASSITLLHVLN